MSGWLRNLILPERFGRVIIRRKTRQKIIALTFDDGPNPLTTPRIVELLHRYQARATFFVNGINARKYPELIKTTNLADNEIGNHTETHPYIIFKKQKEIIKQIISTDQIIRKTGYTGIIHFRAPYGLILPSLNRVLRKMQRHPVSWTFSLLDWQCPAPEVMFRRFIRKIIPGAIVLLHDEFTIEPSNRENTVKLVGMILEKYSTEGYQFVTISELMSIEE
ncbi:MAG: polysaccharide deacetylase family protein [Candidatus Marinimicrobia bacterium]|nr:polysaccharide deacetylase family protein [Candidatus Neomarinimicrobiota bacterium]